MWIPTTQENVAGGGGVTIIDYTQFTANVTISATSAATANTVVTAGAFTPNGSTLVCIEFYSPALVTHNTINSSIKLSLWDGAVDIGQLSILFTTGSGIMVAPALLRSYLTPTAASHTYSIRAWVGDGAAGNGSVQGGAGGAGTNMPGYIRITSGS